MTDNNNNYYYDCDVQLKSNEEYTTDRECWGQFGMLQLYKSTDHSLMNFRNSNEVKKILIDIFVPKHLNCPT